MTVIRNFQDNSQFTIQCQTYYAQVLSVWTQPKISFLCIVALYICEINPYLVMNIKDSHTCWEYNCCSQGDGHWWCEQHGFHSILLASCQICFHIQHRTKMQTHGRHNKVKPCQITAPSHPYICAYKSNGIIKDKASRQSTAQRGIHKSVREEASPLISYAIPCT